ncbi:MAG: hypothetical protein ACRDGR_07460, partial [bacterium]
MLKEPERALLATAVVFLSASVAPRCALAGDDQWWGGFALPPEGVGMNGHVYDLAVYNGELIAA